MHSQSVTHNGARYFFEKNIFKAKFGEENNLAPPCPWLGGVKNGGSTDVPRDLRTMGFLAPLMSSELLPMTTHQTISNYQKLKFSFIGTHFI